MATQPNWWESDPVAPANDPSFTGFMPGAPKPKEPKAPVFVPQGATQMFDPNTGTYAPVPGASSEKDVLKEAIDNLGVDELLLGVQRARKQKDTGWATGTWGAIAELKPGGGTPRDDFKAALDTLQGGVIMEKLQLLKDLSKTGASGMGALSEREGARMAAAVAALHDRMSPEELEISFKTIERHAKALQAIRDGQDPRDPNVAKQYGIPALADIQAEIEGEPKPKASPDPAGGLTGAAYAATGTGGDEAKVDASTVGVQELTDAQKDAYAAFWKQNPDPKPEQLQTFFNGIGVTGVANADEIIRAVKEGKGYSKTRLETDYRTEVSQRVKQQDELGIGADGPANLLFKQGAMLNLGDEASGVGNALANAVTSPLTATEFDPIGSYRLGRDAQRMRIDNAREQLGYGGTAIEFGGALASMGPGAISLLAPKEAAKAAGRGGAFGGALAGYGAGEGPTESLVGAGAGAGLGYAAGRFGPDALAFASKAIPRRFRSPQGMAPELAAASEAEGVDLIRPMVDPRSRAKFGALESDPTAQPIIREGAERTAGQIEEGVSRLASVGTALDTEAAGGLIQGAARRFIKRSKGAATQLYNRARSLAGDARVTPRESLAQLRQELMALRETPDVNQGEIAFLTELGEDLTSGPLSVEAIRGLRTGIRGRINQSGLTASQADARAMRVLDALQRDAEASLPPAAATAFRRADTFYRERMVHIDDVITRFLGRRDAPISGEQAFGRLKSMTSPGGDGRRLAALMRDLDGSERQDIAATIAHTLGRDAPDMPFSAAKFISQTSKLSPSARRTIFGPDGAESINNLRTLSQALKESGADINRSRSTTVANRMSPLKVAARTFIASISGLGGAAATGGSAAGLAGGVAVAAGGMATGAALKTLSARAMVNPRVSRWLAEAANVSTQRQALEATRKLGVIIGREPALARELQPIQDFLHGRLSQQLAAEPKAEGEDDDR